MKIDSSKLVVWLGLIIAVTYNSWLLGYILNPKVAGIGLASDLEAANQPYNWLFIGGDVLCGILTLVIAVIVYRKYKCYYPSLIGLAMFGVLTAASALIPLHCASSINTCGYQIGQTLGVHDITGAVASFGLFIAMLFVTLLSKNKAYFKWNKLVLIAWSLLGLTFLLTGIPAVANMPHLPTLAVIWQDAFLLLSGLLVYLCALDYAGYNQLSQVDN